MTAAWREITTPLGESCRLFHGDCLDVLRDLPDCSVDSIVTDPPAGIRFMSKAWDSDMGGRHSWVAWLSERMTEAYRVLKPGGHALVWALPRTSHWTAWALEDAGFEVRDCLAHLYGAGFPKSLDVGKALDQRAQGQMRRAKLIHFAAVRGVDGHWLQEQGVADARSFADWTSEDHSPSDRNWALIRDALGVTATEEMAFEREVVGQGSSGPAVIAFARDRAGTYDVTAPATDAAREWAGWGTALKPAAEHWWLVRKPLIGTVAANVLGFGTGALNIAACRVAHGDDLSRYDRSATSGFKDGGVYGGGEKVLAPAHAEGRWPSNAVLSHQPLIDPATGEPVGDACADGCVDGCPVAELDAQSGWQRDGVAVQRNRSGQKPASVYGAFGTTTDDQGYGGGGGASRFFPTFRWEAKAPTSERPRINGKAHPTVKPINLLRWMTRLVTPPGGTVLDLFAGTGTTGQAAHLEGFRSILIEQDPESIDLILTRLDERLGEGTAWVLADPDAPDGRGLIVEQNDLFGESA